MDAAITESEAMVDVHRGSLRVYLGAAPGVGKTYAMLSEGHRRHERGNDIVIGFVETHGRTPIEALLDGLEVVTRRTGTANGIESGEMDVEAVIARAPSVALIDELAHTNVPGSRNFKRWQDIEEILAAGIDVVTTMNVQHLESLNDVVESITGIPQQETVPDAVVRRADQIELVDMSPEALRRRLAHGNVYSAEKIDAALTNYFRLGNLNALRELALLWVADRVDDALEKYRIEHDIDSPWPARERVLVALTGGPEGDALIRRGARIAQRAQGGQLLALHVSRSDGMADALPTTLAHQRALVESLSGTWHTVVGDDITSAILTFARGINASQIVLGASRRSRLSAAISPGVGREVVRDCGDIDVHIVTHEHAGRGRRRPPARGPPSRARLTAGWALAVAGPPLLGAVLYFHQGQQGLPNVLMLFLALTVGIALVGGLWPAIFAASASGLLANYWFTDPLHTWAINEPANVLAIIVLVSVAAAVSAVVDLAARRSRQAAHARTEADTLATLAGSVLQSDNAASALLEQVREMFNFSSAALLEHLASGSWAPHGHAGSNPPQSPEEADTTIPVGTGMVLALRGRPISAQDLRIATAMASQTGALIERDRLRAESRNNRQERERTAIRASLLAAVSHDLRTPLAGVKASVSSLRSDLYELTPADQADLLAGIEESADQLKALIDNLLDMSRLDAGAVVPRLAPVALDEVVPRALSAIPAGRVVIDVPETLPLVNADAGLLERAVANVVENAVRHAPDAEPVLVAAGYAGTSLVLRVADRGPGVPENKREDMFHAFQRLGDAPDGHGLGLGLAVARGFTEANGGTLDAEDTPGGGLTMVFNLKIVAEEWP
ncbi:sensor histidine kinase [Arthrobacter sp. H14]|uniref:sensor histidine kinase n=1 Tax=Arthrobacter sp. H14 TaxID=1312959 RepID=UPI0020A61E37|nr:sensor histidine kinase KdpD [Arthrobacter sp. H14]